MELSIEEQFLSAAVVRGQWRAALRTDADEGALRTALAACRERLLAAQAARGLITASLYRYGGMLFLYAESPAAPAQPEELFAPLSALLLPWPPALEAPDAPRLWAAMQPYYYHAVPGTVAEWQAGRTPERRRGRIALLSAETWCDYLYHHLALVREQAIEGDRYHLISLHENLLFSYFEEPKTISNLSGVSGAPSPALEAWLAADPERHFTRFVPNQSAGSDGNFVFLPCCLSV